MHVHLVFAALCEQWKLECNLASKWTTVWPLPSTWQVGTLPGWKYVAVAAEARKAAAIVSFMVEISEKHTK